MKNNKGITLVALVITIIVLLILAGVSISMVVGQNGILSRATNASEKTSEADVRSALETGLSGAQGYFIDAWNKNQSLEFMGWFKTNHASALDGDLDGYTITWTVEGVSGSIKKGTDGTPYDFELTGVGQYGAKLSKWNGKTLGS